MLIAVDGSSSKVGISIWDENHNCIATRGFKFKQGTLLEKAIVFENIIKDLCSFYELKNFVIEQSKESMRSFGAKQISNTKTVKILNQINFGYQLIAYQQGLQVYEIDENIARKLAYPSYRQKKNGIKIKEQYNVLVKSDSSINPEVYDFKKVMKSGIQKGKAVHEEWVEDILDSIVIGKAFLSLQKEGLTPLDLK